MEKKTKQVLWRAAKKIYLAVAETTRKKTENEDKVIKMICILNQVLHEVIQCQGHEKFSVRKLRQISGEPCVNTKV